MRIVLFSLALAPFFCQAQNKVVTAEETVNQVVEEKEVTDEDQVYTIVEQQPEYPGGMTAMTAFIKDNLSYPASAKEKNITGTVFVSFVVGKDGVISDVNTIKGISPECDKEAERLISAMPQWKPGKQNGKLMNVRFFFPVKFTGN
jgi:periplasmic protein TonB